jgi:two-component system response regulator AtoC
MLEDRILLIDDEESLRHMLTAFLGKQGFSVTAAATAKEGLAKAKGSRHRVVICDVVLPDLGGLELIPLLREVDHHQLIIVVSAYGSLETAIEAMRLGAKDYISKPFQPQELLLKIQRALEQEHLLEDNLRLQREIQSRYSFQNIIGKSPRMQHLFGQIVKVANFKTTILITGESGTGKELIARAIHYQGQRRDRPFVAVNCSAIPENLLESELFGHVRGAFTSATSHKRGLFEEADKGTLLLDEVAELPLSLQVKLLRAIQEEEIRKVGDTKTTQVDVRILAATSKDLGAEVAAGSFREELFYRLNVVNLELPPLRERPEDLPLLLEHYLAHFSRKAENPIRAFTKEALSHLLSYSWPGNVRELENKVERAVLLAEGPSITIDDLVLSPAPSPPGRSITDSLPDSLSIKRNKAVMEKSLIRKALERTDGNRTRAAELLELSYRSLLSKIKEYEL